MAEKNKFPPKNLAALSLTMLFFCYFLKHERNYNKMGGNRLFKS